MGGSNTRGRIHPASMALRHGPDRVLSLTPGPCYERQTTVTATQFWGDRQPCGSTTSSAPQGHWSEERISWGVAILADKQPRVWRAPIVQGNFLARFRLGPNST